MDRHRAANREDWARTSYWGAQILAAVINGSMHRPKQRAKASEFWPEWLDTDQGEAPRKREKLPPMDKQAIRGALCMMAAQTQGAAASGGAGRRKG